MHAETPIGFAMNATQKKKCWGQGGAWDDMAVQPDRSDGEGNGKVCTKGTSSIERDHDVEIRRSRKYLKVR